MGTLCNERFLLRRDNISSYIRNKRGVGIFGCLATFSLFALIAFTLSPLYLIPDNTEATTKDPTPSTLTYTAVQSDVVLPVDITSTNGSFATSNDHISFKLATTNATGYTLNIKTSGNDTALVDSSNNDSNTNAISSISSTITRETFSNASNTTYNNKWGIHPSSYYQDNITYNNTNAATSNNPIYFPASSEGFTMDSTSTANTTDNTYFVGLGVRADYTVPAGTYTNATLIAEYVANPVTYAIHYYTNTTDTVTNMPTTNPQTGTVSSPTSSTGSIITTIASTPTRTGYTFLGWCMGDSSSVSNVTTNTTTGVDSCSSTVYDAGQTFGIDATSTNPDTYYLYAMWQTNSYTCTKQYRLQNADGTFPTTYTEDGTEQIKYGETCNYSKTVTNYKNSASGTNGSTTTTSGTMTENGLTLSLDLYRNTFTCKISYKYQNADGTYGSATVAVNTTKRYGEACSWSTASISNYDSTTYKSANYTNNSIAANVDTTVNIDRNTFTITRQYRLQGTDTNYPSTYTADGTVTVCYGASYTYSIAATTTHQAASTTVSNVTSSQTLSLSVPRKTFTITKQYKLQDTSGNYPSSYTSDGTATVVYGGSYTYSRSATTTHQAASKSVSNVTSNQTISLDAPRNLVACNKRYRLQGADGNYPSSYTSDGSVNAYYGGSCSYSKTVTDYNSNNSKSTSASNVTSTQTLSLDFPRNTYTLTVSKGTNIASVTGGGTYRWGQSVTVTATKSTNTTCIAYGNPTWTASAGTAPSAGASTTYTMPKSDATVTASSAASNVSQTITLSRTGGAASIKIGNTTYTSTSVSLTCGTYNISGTYNTNYEFSSWSRANGVAVASTTSASTTMTVTGAGTLTLTGKATVPVFKINFDSGIDSVIVRGNTVTSTILTTVTTSGTDIGSMVSIGGTYYLLPLYKQGKTLSNITASGGSVTAGTYGYRYYTVVNGTNTATVSSTDLATTSSTTMQNLASNTCQYYPTAVKDSRDNEIYYIQRLADGNCWMLDNMRLGGTSPVFLSTSDSNIGGYSYQIIGTPPDVQVISGPVTSYVLPAGSWTLTYTDPKIYASEKNNTTTSYGPGSGKIGVLYNVCATTSGNVCSQSSSSGSSYDICPAGWRLPTSGSSGEFINLMNYYGATMASNDKTMIYGNVTNYNKAISATLSGSVANARKNLGEWAWMASSTYSNDCKSTSGGHGNICFSGTGPSSATPMDANSWNGQSIRCVLKQ